MSGFNAT